MTISITHRGMELTPAIRSFVEEKMRSLLKYDDAIRHMDVEVGLASGNHHKGDIFLCKVVVQKEGDVFQMERESEDLYKAIDKVRDHLRDELSDRKKRSAGRMRA